MSSAKVTVVGGKEKCQYQYRGRKLVKTTTETPEKGLRNFPSVLTSNIWTHFGFCNKEGRKDMEMTQATCVLAACENQVFWEYDEHSLTHHM